jgi:hypothetical protein
MRAADGASCTRHTRFGAATSSAGRRAGRDRASFTFRPEWGKATATKGAFVEAETPCTTPNVVLDDSLACENNLPNDICRFVGVGQGKGAWTLKRVSGLTSDDAPRLAFSAVLTGLDSPCEGEHLSLVIDVRESGLLLGCGGNVCTYQDRSRVLGSCDVNAGRCQIKGVAGFPFFAGLDTLIEIFGVRIVRGSVTAFNAGLALQ